MVVKLLDEILTNGNYFLNLHDWISAKFNARLVVFNSFNYDVDDAFFIRISW